MLEHGQYVAPYIEVLALEDPPPNPVNPGTLHGVTERYDKRAQASIDPSAFGNVAAVYRDAIYIPIDGMAFIVAARCGRQLEHEIEDFARSGSPVFMAQVFSWRAIVAWRLCGHVCWISIVWFAIERDGMGAIIVAMVLGGLCALPI